MAVKQFYFNLVKSWTFNPSTPIERHYHAYFDSVMGNVDMLNKLRYNLTQTDRQGQMERESTTKSAKRYGWKQTGEPDDPISIKQAQLRLCQLGPGTVLCPHSNLPLRFALVVFAWKCRLFCLCSHGQCRVYYIYHVEFHFQFGHLITYPVWHQLLCGCQGEKSSKKCQVTL